MESKVDLEARREEVNKPGNSIHVDSSRFMIIHEEMNCHSRFSRKEIIQFLSDAN